MREIKFRGKHRQDNKWVYGDLLHTSDIGTVISNEDFFGSVPNKSVGQYTGLKDKNGKEIYEGDIVRTNNTGNVGKIVYVKEHSSFVVHSNDKEGAYYEHLEEGLCKELFEAIGNIHENPELLRGAKTWE